MLFSPPALQGKVKIVSVAVRRSKVRLYDHSQRSLASLLSLLSLLQTPSRRHTPHNLQLHPHQPTLKMCFRTSTSVESSASSSSDEPIARIIDLPTVRRLNSPRCAARGNAYIPGASAASDRTQLHVPDHAATADAKQQKSGECERLRVVCAPLTVHDSREVSSSFEGKSRPLYQDQTLYPTMMNLVIGECVRVALEENVHLLTARQHRRS
jgi:hypothetical protein